MLSCCYWWRGLMINGECVVAASSFLSGLSSFPQNNISQCSLKKNFSFHVDLCSQKKVPLLPFFSYLYGSLTLWEFLFPLLMRVDGLFSMESMTADMECTTIRVPGFLFCPPKGSLIQPQYFLIRCIFPDLKII